MLFIQMQSFDDWHAYPKWIFLKKCLFRKSENDWTIAGGTCGEPIPREWESCPFTFDVWVGFIAFLEGFGSGECTFYRMEVLQCHIVFL
mmetsp:Transcript_7816/g.11763  ORF Transcript_7816/g.11763 Transcript_7816/m.11763 type:complete len:89 (+) Transcript_7816:1665-1931(+)